MSADATDGPDDRTGSGTAEPGAPDPPDAPDTSASPSVESEEDALAQLEHEDALAELEYEDLLAKLDNDPVLGTPDAEAGHDEDEDEDEDEDLRLDDDQLAELSYDAGLDELDADEGSGADEGEDADDEGEDADDSAGEAPRAAAPPVDFHELHDMGEGDVIVRVDVWATAAFALVAALAAAFPDGLVAVFVPLSLLLFLGGCVAFVWAFARGVARSRFEAITMGGLFFLTEGVAPARIRRALRSIFGVQVVVAVAAAVVRPFTPLAFGTLVPILGLGLMALWAARHGEFPPKPTDD